MTVIGKELVSLARGANLIVFKVSKLETQLFE